MMLVNDMNKPVPDVVFNTIIADIIKERVQIRVPNNIIDKYDVYQYYSESMAAWIIEIERCFLREFDKDIEQTESVPDTWWDHWKLEHPKITRYLPEKLREIKYRKIITKINISYNYPYSGYALNKKARDRTKLELLALANDKNTWSLSAERFCEEAKYMRGDRCNEESL